MAVHPAALILQTTPEPQPVDMSDLLAYLEQNQILVLPDEATLAATELPDTNAVYIVAENSFYNYDGGDTTSAADGHFILFDGTAGTPRRYKLQGFTTSLNILAGAGAVALAWTNQPAAINFWQVTATRSVQRLNLTPYKYVRLHVLLTVAGAAGSFLMLRYFQTYSTTIGDYIQLGTSEAQVSLAAIGFTSSAWIPLAAAARGDLFLALMGIGGDAIIDPTFAQIWAEFSS